MLVYDGDCRFCRFWVRRWRRATGERVVYRPFQEVAARLPNIPRRAFTEAVQLILPDGSVESGADAVFHVLEFAPQRQQRMRWLRRLPGLMPVARCVYRFVSQHRAMFWKLTRRLAGKTER